MNSETARASFVLKRTLPDGTERQSLPCATKRAAAVDASRVLYDNENVAKGEAQQFGARLGRLPLGEALEHASGYKFMIEKVIW